MADRDASIDAAEAEVQKVVSLLVNRFGHEHEVFEHLTMALSHLREARTETVSEEAMAAAGSGGSAGDGGTSDGETEAATIAESEQAPAVEPDAAPSTPKRRRTTRRRKR